MTTSKTTNRRNTMNSTTPTTTTGPTVTRPPAPAGTPRWAITGDVQIRVG